MRLFVLNLCLLSLLRNCLSEECLQELRENVDFPGSDVLQIFSPDVHHCQQACSQHHSCQFFTFIRPDWTSDSRQFYCYLKHTSSGLPSQITDLQGVTSGYSLKNCKKTSAPQSVCLSSVYQDVDFTGADYDSLFTANYEECQRACTSDPRCQFFSWLNNDFARPQYKYKCHLKYSWSVSKPPVVKTLSGVVSGFSQKFCSCSQSVGQKETCKGQILTDTDFPGHDFEQTPAVSAGHCQFLCSAHPKCTYFTYERNTMTCFLKNSKDEKPEQRKEELYSGMPCLFCEPSWDWLSVRYEDTDFHGFDIRYAYLDDPQSCEALCTTDPHCQFYTYVYTSFHDSFARKRCYLKQVITIPVPPKVVAMTGVVSGFSLRGCSNAELVRAAKGLDKYVHLHLISTELQPLSITNLCSHLHFLRVCVCTQACINYLWDVGYVV